MTVAVARVRHATMSVRGSAIHHARLLINDVVPDALRVSCVDDVIRIEAPEADLRIQLRPALAGDGTRLSFCATFREDKPAGGTWWVQLGDGGPRPAAQPPRGRVHRR
ncbi:hypothetical protein [Streptomyces sp. RTd22]|uniref:hypothetical protein n=1 Tax=Streptomyces sp. RTd22 TaxID=1841249 RepID=UPI000AC228E4|nr:hypothetical protein [Streptomyces sp. RTd22]